MKMKSVLCFICVWLICKVSTEIQGSAIMNKLNKIKAVGRSVGKTFVPLTTSPPPRASHYLKSGRRHFEEECTEPASDGEREKLDYHSDDEASNTVATVILPDHIDHKHFEVTTQVPYFTVGPIEGIGHQPSTKKLNDCEKIYQEHIREMYSDEPTDSSEESLEVELVPVLPPDMPVNIEDDVRKLYRDLNM